ncbi:Ubiquitin fusion degradation protein 1 homolog [Linum grandiflorum]
MDFELRRAREKLEKEQKERKEKARLRLAREKKAKDEARKQREALESVQRSRRLEAAEAQLKADEQMQENLIVGRGIVFSRVLEAVGFQGSGDRIKLPPSCFTELSDQGAFDKGPLYFQLSVVGSSESTNSGVLEFTAEEGKVELPPHVWSNLFSTEINTDAPLVEVRYVWLPKGTYAKLQPNVVGFSDIPNHKAVLETSLRQHATLSEGDVITVNHGVLSYKLRVLELKPSSSVSVLETDVEVDIVGSDSPVDEGLDQQHVLKGLTFGVLESGKVEEGKYKYYKFLVDDLIWETIASGAVMIEVKIEVETDDGDGDTDLYISKHPLLFPNRHQHEWSSHDIGSKVLFLTSKDKNLGVGTYSVGVYGFKGTAKYKVSVSARDNSTAEAGKQAGSSSMDVDAVECRNCKHFIPSRSIALHEAYCARHNVACKHPGCGVVLRVGEAKNHVHCDKCGLAFHKDEINKHTKVFHEPVQCPCGVILEREPMVQHQASVCPLRLITCRFCGDMVQAGSSATDTRDRMRGLTEHESLCGSRTTPCDSCGRSVMLKEMDIHQVAVHQKG